MSDVYEMTDPQFDAWVMASELPVLIDFTASWCGPCKAIKSVVKQLATAHAGKLKVAFVDIDRCPKIARRYGIKGVPSLYLFEGGEVVGKLSGGASKAQLESFVERVVS